MAGVTSSWKTTVSPMTIAPCDAGVNAAQEPRPANGLSGMPSTVTATSVRAHAMRTTPSGAVVVCVPAALPMRPASRRVSGAPVRYAPAPRIDAIKSPDQVAFLIFLCPVRRYCLDASSLPELGHLKVVEVSLRVRLGPQADLSGFLDRLVRRFEFFRAVEVALELFADVFDRERVPAARRDLDLFLGNELRPFPVDDVVEAIVVFQRVEAGDVIVVWVLVAPDEAAALILVSFHRLEVHAQLDILVVAVPHDAEVKERARSLRGLGEHQAALGRGGVIGYDLPDAAL